MYIYTNREPVNIYCEYARMPGECMSVCIVHVWTTRIGCVFACVCVLYHTQQEQHRNAYVCAIARRKHELMRACAREHITHIIFVLFYCAHALTSYRCRRRRHSKRRRLRFGGDRARVWCAQHIAFVRMCVAPCAAKLFSLWSADLVGS